MSIIYKILETMSKREKTQNIFILNSQCKIGFFVGNEGNRLH